MAPPGPAGGGEGSGASLGRHVGAFASRLSGGCDPGRHCTAGNRLPPVETEPGGWALDISSMTAEEGCLKRNDRAPGQRGAKS